jgi:hypothetical protein
MIHGIIAGGLLSSEPAIFPAAVIYRTANSSSLAGGTAVPYQTEMYDGGDYADLGTQDTRLTVSEAGLYRATYQTSTDTNGTRTKLEVNGADAPGVGGSHSSTVGKENNGCSAVLALDPADYVTLEAIGGGVFGYNNNDKYTWLSLERLPDTLSYCLVRKPATQAATGWGTMAVVTFGSGATVHDPDGYHDESTNNSRLTTLSGQTRIRLSGGVVSDGSAGTGGLTFRKNGAGQTLGGTLTPGLPFWVSYGSSSARQYSVMTPPLLVVGGTDYFELFAMMDAGGIDDVDGTFFCIEEVPTDITACLAYKSTAFALTTSYQDVPMDTDVYDDDAIHDAAGSSAEFIVPAGATHARFHFCIGQGDMCKARAMLNGAEIVGGSTQSAESGAFWHYGMGRTPWIPVTPGDAFKMQAHSDRSANSVAGPWAALECWPKVASLRYADSTLAEDATGSVTPQYYAEGMTPTFTLEAGTLPAGMSLNSSTGVISGTPTTAGANTDIQIKMTYTGGNVVSAPFDITVIAGYDNINVIFIGSNDGAGDVLIREMTLSATHGGADLTTGQTPTGSGGFYSGAEGPDKAINNNTGDWWQPRCSPASTGQVNISIPMPSITPVTEMTIDPHPSFLGRTPKGAEVWGSVGGGTPVLIQSFSGWTSWSGPRTLQW